MFCIGRKQTRLKALWYLCSILYAIFWIMICGSTIWVCQLSCVLGCKCFSSCGMQIQGSNFPTFNWAFNLAYRKFEFSSCQNLRKKRNVFIILYYFGMYKTGCIYHSWQVASTYFAIKSGFWGHCFLYSIFSSCTSQETYMLWKDKKILMHLTH